jgi:hypothetical protein
MSYFGSKIELKDGPQLDAFSRLRVSVAHTLFDSQQEYGLQTSTTWDANANGVFATPSTNGSATSGSNAVGPVNANTRMTPITVSTTNNHYSILQSRQYSRYIPGKGHLVFLTGVFASGANATAKFVRRTSTSGSVSDSDDYDQAEWNIDTFDGTGPSGITIDFTKTQILFISAQWLGVGRVVVGFDINGVLYPAHQFLHANVLTVPYTQTFNLPVRYQIRTSGTDSIAECGYFDAYNGIFLRTTLAHNGVAQTINAVCASVQSESGEESRGYPRTANTGVSTTAVTTRRPVLSIRPSALFNTLTNRCHIEMADYRLVASTNNALFEIVLGGTLTAGGGAPTWNSAATNSAADYNTNADAIVGGSILMSDFVLTGGGAVRGESSGVIDIRNPLTISQIDSTLNRQDAISIVCTSFTGTSNILAAMNWHEQQT